MANSELFVLGDARFLSGGAPRSNNTTYNEAPPRVRRGEAVTSSRLMKGDIQEIPIDRNFTKSLMTRSGQSLHSGRDSYHEHEWHPDRSNMRPNVFISDGDVPTAGVEIETYARDPNKVNEMRNALWSNWFHFEEDGSLDRVVGHELITDVLPPRVYRDLRTWVGLQNLTAPWLDSFGHSETGLHVHVGVQQFETCRELPCQDRRDRVALAKFAIAFCYHGLLDASFLDKVFLRKGGNFCAAAADKTLLTDVQLARSGNLLAGDMFDRLYSTFTGNSCLMNTVVKRMSTTGTDVDRLVAEFTKPTLQDGQRWLGPSGSIPQRFSGHHVEINMPHAYTIEFRRGKGTLNAVSIHRMIECVTLVTRFVWKACREPALEISPKSLYGFMADNTNSNALKTMAMEQLGKLPKKGE